MLVFRFCGRSRNSLACLQIPRVPTIIFIGRPIGVWAHCHATATRTLLHRISALHLLVRTTLAILTATLSEKPKCATTLAMLVGYLMPHAHARARTPCLLVAFPTRACTLAVIRDGAEVCCSLDQTSSLDPDAFPIITRYVSVLSCALRRSFRL